MKKTLLSLALLVTLGCVGCSSSRQIRYEDKTITQAEAYEATLKAFEDYGLAPKGNPSDFVIESHWDWLGIGAASDFLLFPLSWAQFTAEVRADKVDLEAHAYGLNWLSVWMNLPVGFPIGKVADRVRDRLKEIRPPAASPAG